MAREKSPAFQFYPKDFLADSKQAAMSATAVGCYIRLLCYCWIDGSLPSDTLMIARMSGYKGRQWASIWVQLEVCFTAHDGRWIHPRIERERQKQAEYRERKRLAGSAGGRQKASNMASKPLADLVAERSSSSSSSVRTTPPTPLSAKGGRLTRKELAHARTVLKNRFGRCQHDPECANPDACVQTIAAIAADRKHR